MVYHGDTEESESDSGHEHTGGMVDNLNSSSLCEFISHPAKMFCMYTMSSVSQASISDDTNRLLREETCLNKGFFTR